MAMCKFWREDDWSEGAGWVRDSTERGNDYVWPAMSGRFEKRLCEEAVLWSLALLEGKDGIGSAVTMATFFIGSRYPIF